jgi:beta-N-acetylhexosaminidase
VDDVARLAGETLCVGVPGDEVDAATREDLSALAPGAFVLFARNVSTLEKTRTFVAALRAAAGGDVPALVCVDQEGGRVARLRFDRNALPSMMALGATRDAALAFRAGARLADDLRAIGANVDFAPVLDLALEGGSTVIGTRALGDEPHAVAALGVALVRGLEANGIATAPKHFPGHGATALDSHAVLPTIAASLCDLRARELVPFAAAFAAGARAVMSAHIVVSAIDADRPATLSPLVLTTLLRDELGFEGVCFTDCLQMDAVAANVGTVRAAVLALAAGADCCIVSHDLALARKARDAIVTAVAEGSLPYQRLAEAAARVRALRRALASESSAPSVADGSDVAGEIATRAVTRVAGDARLDLAAAVTVVSFEGAADDGIAASDGERPSLSLALRRRRMRSELLRVPLEPDRAMREMLLDVVSMQGARNVVVVARRAHLYPAQREAISALLEIAPHAVAISAREPFDIDGLARARGVLCSFGDEESSIEALADVLCGRSEPSGTLPVAVPSPVR